MMDRVWEYSQSSEVIIAIAAAGLLYFCRLRLKFLYGIIEVMAGMYLLYLLIYTTAGGFDTLHFTVAITSYLGAIFVMVRGFDNIQSGWHGIKTSTLAASATVMEDATTRQARFRRLTTLAGWGEEMIDEEYRGYNLTAVRCGRMWEVSIYPLSVGQIHLGARQKTVAHHSRTATPRSIRPDFRQQAIPIGGDLAGARCRPGWTGAARGGQGAQAAL